MPRIMPIPAVMYDLPDGSDASSRIAPPYDVLNESAKHRLLQRDPRNIVEVDLPHLPPKTVGPDSAYQGAGETYRQWLNEGVLKRRGSAMFVYRQTFEAGGERFARTGLVANVAVQPFGASPDGQGGVFPHEQTFSQPKEDRLKLMRATAAQLSPIFGLYSDAAGDIGGQLDALANGGPTMTGRTDDGVLHELWTVDAKQGLADLTEAMSGVDVFIADGHHRYNTALNYRQELEEKRGTLPPGDPARGCLFVLVAIQDPGMIVLPTHRVLGGMSGYSMAKFIEAGRPHVNVTPFNGSDLVALELELPKHGPHAIGLYDPAADSPMAILTTHEQDPLGVTYRDHHVAWRTLDVTIVQHLIVDAICSPNFTEDRQPPTWKFPHALDELKRLVDDDGHQLGLIMQPPTLDAIRQVSEAGELMPQKSTFFYPKLATGMVINPLD